MRKFLGLSIIGLVLVITSCVHRERVVYPPAIDLKQHEVIGILEFKCSNKGNIAANITKRFMQAMRQDQGMVRIIELGSEKEVLKAVNVSKLGPEAYKAIGEKYGVSTIVKGEFIASEVKPDVSLFTGAGLANVSAKVDASLNTEMVESATGASLWNKSVSAVSKVGEVSVFSGKDFAFDAKDPDKAYGELMNNLVSRSTAEFRATWGYK